MDTVRTLALVDDDAAILDSLGLFFAQNGIEPAVYSDAETLLRELAAGRDFDCVVADIRMPGMSGMDLLKQIVSRPAAPPVVLITGHGDIAMAVSAVKIGAFDFLEKPFNEEQLLDTAQRAMTEFATRRATELEREQRRQLFDSLPPRQRQVLELVAAGFSAKEIAQQLEISPRTVEGHRAWGMQKIRATSLAELIRVVMTAQDPGLAGRHPH